MEKHAVSKIIGSPPGYVGYDDGGQLTEKVRRKPYCVILFDEVEKAHPDVCNLFLQILEDGVLTSADGRKVSFKNTVIIMTSNVGASLITENRAGIGFADALSKETAVSERVLSELKKTFKPEFLNRVDSTIVFEKLEITHIEQICRLLLAEVGERAAKAGITLTFADEVVCKLAEDGYDKAYGARPLRRLITDKIENLLSEQLLSGKIAVDDEIGIIIEGGEFTVCNKSLLKKS
jgi:ATP-dependent Clp protease ATP-binding subunit ClpC